MKKLLIPVILFIGISLNAVAQEKSKKETQGDKYAFRYSYDKAIKSYTGAKQLTPEGQRKLAESYHKMNRNVESEVVYSKLISAQTGVLPEDYYNYSMALKTNEKYSEATTWMDKFESQKPTDLRSIDYAANKSRLPDLLKDDGKYKTDKLKINSDADDFGTSWYNSKIVFASTHATPKMIKRRYNLNGKPFLNMYVSETDGQQLKEPDIFNKSFNSKMHDGPASFSNKGTFMAFTRNNNKDKSKDKIVELQIWFSNLKDGKWSKPEAFILNNPEYSVGHPCLTKDGNTMYFTSDMPGGYGGTDIYRVTRVDKGAWGKAENLGTKINTEGDEMFPFYEERNQVLFFASDGRFGLGGLDIFICPVNGAGFGNAYNAGTPLNSRFDDFAAIADSSLDKGYFSSARTDGDGDDIYSVDFLKSLGIGKKIRGIAKDKDSKPVSGTFITLADEKGNVIDTLTTKEDAAYAFSVETDRNFNLNGKKDTYTDGTNTASTFGNEYVITSDVVLLKKEEVLVQKPIAQQSLPEKIKAGGDLGKILELKSIYFDLDKYNTRPDAEVELMKIVKIMNDYPDMVVELSSYTDCRATKAYNQVLSDKRAKSSAEFIQKRITRPGRITGKGYAESKLVNGCACEGDVVSDCSEDEQQKNRRTEFTIIKSGISLK
jgi:outer membrane protein OmpA-like peptidoglycan-associated protein